MSTTRRPGLDVLRRLRMREVVLFSLPPFVAALWLLAASVADYQRLTRFDDWWSNVARVDHFAWWRVRTALRLPQAIAFDHSLSAEDTQRALVDLRVNRDEFDRIANDPVGQAGKSVKAYLAEGNARQQVDLKLRGDTSVHWTGEKKTLAIKSDRGEMFHDSRVNVFSCKEVLAQFAANSMAQDFGLLAPQTAVVPVFLNQRFNGMFRTFEPPDETFIRNAGRIPGNIFRGDTAERGDYFKGLPRELFVNPYIWDRVAKNDRPGAIGTAKLFEFVARVNRAGSNELPSVSGEDDSVSKLFEILDRDEISLLLALDLCVGDPWHSSGVHNHFWYEDSSSGLLHPIPWDLRMLDLEHPPPNSQYNRFWRAALRDPRIFAKALKQIHDRNRDGALLASVTQRVNETWQRYRDGFEFDRLRCGPPGTAPNADVGSPEEVLGTLRKNLATLDGWCSDARVSVAMNQLDKDTLMLDVLVDGRAPIRWNLIAPGEREFTVTADTDFNGVPSAGDRATGAVMNDRPLVDGTGPRPFESLWPGVRAMQRLEPEGICYRYFVKSPKMDSSVISLAFTNAITGAKVQPTKLSAGSAMSSTTSVHPWTFREPPVGEMRLAGEVHLTKTLEIQRNTTLIIEPGTKLVLDPDVSIHCKGRVDAVGTDSAQITISSSDPRHPWGSFALWGEGANKSEFKHVHFSGGGGALLEDVEYTGMVCVHWARNVRFEGCEFTGNQRCDDGLHLDMADATVSRCWFHDTNADALDLDISSATIEHCKIERAGNDGFDLMTCSPRIIGNEISGSLDKGISIGENSSPFVFGNKITNCFRGIEAKDRSWPVILNNTIEGSRIGVKARLKNWRYERGGWPQLVRTILSGNDEDLRLEAKSRISSMDLCIGASDALALPQSDANLQWLYALEGVTPDSPSLGVVSKWRETPRANVLDEEHFPAGWYAPESLWHRAGGVTSLRAQEGCLVIRMTKERGQSTRAVAWNLSDEKRKNWLVLDASATAIKSAQVRVHRRGEVRDEDALHIPLELGADEAHFRYTVLPLPAGSYDSLTLEFEPRDASGRVNLHGWQIVSALAADVDGAK